MSTETLRPADVPTDVPTGPPADLPLTERTLVTRHRERQVTDRAALDAVLDDGLVAHVAVSTEHGPVVLPMAYGRDGDRLLLHGSSGAGLLRTAASGVRVAVAVTHVDGLVYARSVFDSSVNYRSVVVHGTATAIGGSTKMSALHALSERLMPGRWGEVREPTTKELAATLVLELPLDEASVKVRTGPPGDGEGADPSVWAGVLPVQQRTGAPETAPEVRPGTPVPASVRGAAVPSPASLALLGEQVAADGLVAHTAELEVVAGEVEDVAPGAAAALTDAGQPDVVRERALAVASSALSRLAYGGRAS